MVKYELLAPAGDFRNLFAAIQAGADAVYFGVQGFNMRANAKNFTVDDLPKIKEVCEQKNPPVRRYLTLNTIMFDGELQRVEEVLIKAKPFVNAFICWDPAVISLCKKHNVEFHISTQASVANSQSAQFYKDLGASRIVLARELSIDQIKEISKIIDIECFCHGAMCVAISGRCFMSQHVHGLSANRGKCAQVCRREFTVSDHAGNELQVDNNFVLSAKDLCTLPFIGKLKEAGVRSFKIEGRNRSPEYVSTVVSVYRKALDNDLSREEIDESLKELRKVYNRGQSTGFYLGTPTNDDFASYHHGEQTEHKEFVGLINRFWPKAGVFGIKLSAGEVRVGDELYLISDKQAVRRIKVSSLKHDDKSVDAAVKGDDISIKVDDKVFEGDEVYVIREKS